MCSVSAVGDSFKDGFKQNWPQYYEHLTQPPIPNWPAIQQDQHATKDDIAELRREILALKDLLKAALKYDEETSQPHCENGEKIALIKQVAEMVGVDLSDLKLE